MKTAKEILKGHLFVSDEGDIKGHIKFAISAMEEYGKQMYNQAASDKWAPALSPPKDTKPILGLCKNGFPVIAYYSDGTNLMAVDEDEDERPLPKAYYTLEQISNSIADESYIEVFIEKWMAIPTNTLEL